MLCTVKKTINQIVDSGNHFIIQVKGNAPKLRSHLLDEVANYGSRVDIVETEDKQRGRIDKRKYEVYPIVNENLPNGWHHIKSVIMVTRQGTRKGKDYKNYTIYISDLKNTPIFFSKGIRQHWSIENNLHRQKDVYQNEDNNQIKNQKLAIITSILQTIVLNLFQTHGYKSIKKANEKYANRTRACFDMINSNLYIDKIRTV